MSTGSTPRAPIPDISGQILFAMRNMGVAPIPRNYNLFYEAFIGSNPALTKDLAALGNKANQEELDEIGARYFDYNHSKLIESVQEKLHSELEALLLLLRHEQSSLENYNRILDETRERIIDKNISSATILKTAISLLSDATGHKISEGEDTSKNFDRHAEEMQQVRLELDEYKRIAHTDSLTRLSNRRAFDDKLASVYDTSIGLHLSALVLLDVDNFKRINDTYGHPVGDKILASVASVIRSAVRKDVFVARSGGEEFAILLEGNNQEEIRAICERIRLSLEKTPFRNSKSGTDYGQVTISIGCAMASQAGNPGELYAHADAALYHAKETGRNRTVFFEESMHKNYTGKSWLIYKK
ncbi:GGDEF domain-containing protein [Agrobacterium larrymoorei]|uniref:GGDEF domain-containing protein n=1 Tax=Agrobacterium larrymoorei TaxID=160699 RepID=UPI0015747605|nr:GGDEF domain-containing protein [Agrobacterium larrymoorei]NTJ42212.1 GGDEF domain-containing protein [Agrobacterium larrymoorei]